MVIINLLPWREKKKRYEGRILKKILLSAFILACFILLIMQLSLSYLQKKSDDRRVFLETELNKYSAIMVAMQDEEQLSSRQSLDRTYLQEQSRIESFLKLLSEQNHYDVCFKQINRKKNMMSFVGDARSALEFTEFIKNWHASSLFSEINIQQLNNDSQTNLFHFRFQGIFLEG